MSTLKSKASSLKHNIKDKILKATLALGLGAGGCAANQQYGDLPDSSGDSTPFPLVGDNGGGYGNGDWVNRSHHNRDHGPQNRSHGGGGNHGGGHTGGGGGHGGGGHKR